MYLSHKLHNLSEIKLGGKQSLVIEITRLTENLLYIQLFDAEAVIISVRLNYSLQLTHS